MAVRYYDDLITAKLKKWMPDNSTLRILGPEESKRLFETIADDNLDKPFKLPLISLSRNNDIELLSNIKQLKSFNGLKLESTDNKTLEFNVIPIRVEYQLNIYTKTYEEGDEYLRNFLFKLINNPLLVIEIPYSGKYVRHTANLRVLSTVSNTSSVGERLFAGQFTRWTINLELQDAFLFSLPYKKNWRLIVDNTEIVYPDGTTETVHLDTEERGALEIYEDLNYENLIESEPLDFNIQKLS